MSGQESLRKHVAKRILYAIPTILIVIILNFFIIHSAPGDPAVIIAGDVADPQYLSMIRSLYGLDRPLYDQFLTYLGKVLVGDLGYSYRYRQPVLDLIIARLPATLLLTLSSIIFATLIGIVLGVRASRKAYSSGDNAITIFSLVGYSMPIAWIGILFLLFFSLQLNLLPAGGLRTIGAQAPSTGIGLFIDTVIHMILPVTVLGLNALALISRLTRANMLEALGMDYIMTARSKGLSESTVFYKHALKNAMLPIVTVVAAQARWIFAGAILTETVFSWPGIGRLMYDSLTFRDYPTIMGILVITSIIVIAANLIADVLYSFLDPRIRYGKGR